jgi:hypothetical protein
MSFSVFSLSRKPSAASEQAAPARLRAGAGARR